MTLKNVGPWKFKKRILKYKNPWLRVYEDQVVRPDEQDGIFGVVKVKNGISVLPIDDEGFVYLVKQFRYLLGKNTIEVVSGGIDKREGSLTAAKRELKEELGILADKWIKMGSIDSFGSTLDHKVSLFLARGLIFFAPENEETENIKLLKVKLEEAVHMVISGKILNADSCILILKAARYLQKY